MENPGPSYSAESTSQKMFIGTDKISEILINSDSDVVLHALVACLYLETSGDGRL
jgi:2C-methyl-D-erythritol 2,4-cyclodiphosphate synthase